MVSAYHLYQLAEGFCPVLLYQSAGVINIEKCDLLIVMRILKGVCISDSFGYPVSFWLSLIFTQTFKYCLKMILWLYL